MVPGDRSILDLFARRVRSLIPSAAIWAFGSRARGGAHPESDFDLCVVLPEVTQAFRDDIYAIAWEIGFDAGQVLTTIIVSQEDFRTRLAVCEHARREHPSGGDCGVTEAERSRRWSNTAWNRILRISYFFSVAPASRDTL